MKYITTTWLTILLYNDLPKKDIEEIFMKCEQLSESLMSHYTVKMFHDLRGNL